MMRAYQYLPDNTGWWGFVTSCCQDAVANGHPFPTVTAEHIQVPLEGSWLIYLPEAGFHLATDTEMRRMLLHGEDPIRLYERPDNVR
jgi:hypothetical protein